MDADVMTAPSQEALDLAEEIEDLLEVESGSLNGGGVALIDAALAKAKADEQAQIVQWMRDWSRMPGTKTETWQGIALMIEDGFAQRHVERALTRLAAELRQSDTREESS